MTNVENQLKYPAHAEDVLHFLEFILEWDGPSGAGSRPYDSSRLYLLGHSCTAYTVPSILMNPPPDLAADAPNTLNPTLRLLRSVRGVVLSGGGYDLDTLMDAVPSHKDKIVKRVFGDLPSYQAFNLTRYGLKDGSEHIRWLVIYSHGDKVVNRAQSEAMIAGLKHAIAAKQGSGDVGENWELSSGHNEMLREDGYPHLVDAFVREVERTV